MSFHNVTYKKLTHVIKTWYNLSANLSHHNYPLYEQAYAISTFILIGTRKKVSGGMFNMNGYILNQFFSQYFVALFCEYMMFILMCKSFKLKTSKRKAYFIGFVCSNFAAITNSLFYVIIAGEYIVETQEVLLAIKLITILGELIFLGFIVLVLDVAWYRIYWLCILTHLLIAFPYLIYGNMFLKENVYRQVKVIPVTLESLPKYLFSIIVCIAWGCIFLFLSRYVKRYKKVHQIPKWSWFAIYSGWAFVVINTNKSYQEVSPKNFANDIGVGNYKLVLFAIVEIAIIMFLSKNHSDKRLLKLENTLLKQQNKIQYANYLTMQQQEIQIHKLYHDIGNHINTIQTLFSSGEIQEAKQYTESLAKQYKDISTNFYCSNRIINAVLSQKLKICDQSEITYDIDIKIPDKLIIDDIDLMSVYSNLLDNAIESCKRNNTSKNYIKIRTSLIGNYFAVKIINSKSVIKEVLEDKNKFPTWKRNKSMHGYGLKILEEIVERYDGQKEIQDNGEEFSALVMLKAQ